jgi:4'-phosphopantetheinyl transferase
MVAEPRAHHPSLSESVHVWPLHLTASPSTTEILTSCLDEAERARAARIQVDDGWRRFVLGRGALRLILGRYLKRRPSDVVFAYGVHGKPGLAESDLCFNYSASGGAAVMAFGIGTDIGIDVEEVRTIDQPLDIASKYFHPLEVRELAAMSATERDVAFLRLWTCKEAVVKAVGLGLSMALDSFCLTDFATGNARLAHRPAVDDGSEWQLCDVSVPRDYVAALAYRRPSRTIVREPMRTLDELFAQET